MWLEFVAWTGLSERLLFIIGTSASISVTSIFFNLCLYFCYKFDLFPSKRIQGGVMPDALLIRECISEYILNFLVVRPLVLYALYPYFVYCGTRVAEPIPSWQYFVRDIFVSYLLNDTLFYWAHRTMHSKYFYKYIHKKHHQFKASIGIAAEYAHPIEDLLCNSIPTISGSLLMGSHVVVIWVWLSLRIVETIDGHSGYNFDFSPFHWLPFASKTERHDFHHSHNIGCYGAYLIFWDYVMGTDAAFIKFKSMKGKKNID